MAASDKTTCIQCVDNPHGYRGAVVFDDVTFPISSHQGTGTGDTGDGQGPRSSVTVFQLACYEDPRLWSSPETVLDSNTSVEEDVDEEE